MTAAETQLGRLCLRWWDELSGLETLQRVNTALLVIKQKPIHHETRGSTFAHTRGSDYSLSGSTEKTNFKTKTKRPAASQGTRGGGDGAPTSSGKPTPATAHQLAGSAEVQALVAMRVTISLCLCLSTSRGWSNCAGNHDVDCQEVTTN